jgi:hypothetical protein
VRESENIPKGERDKSFCGSEGKEIKVKICSIINSYWLRIFVSGVAIPRSNFQSLGRQRVVFGDVRGLE